MHSGTLTSVAASATAENVVAKNEGEDHGYISGFVCFILKFALLTGTNHLATERDS